MAERPILIAGASGFVGQHLATYLHRAGRQLRCGSRSPDRERRLHPHWQWVELNLDRPETMGPALEGCRALVYLARGLSGPSTFGTWEEHAAERLLDAAERAGVERIVYLGAVAPAGPPSAAPSSPLAARLRVGEILREGSISTIELRAGMIVGVGSESWCIVRDLASRLPLMILPKWLDRRIEPVAIHDVVVALAHALDDPLVGSSWFDLPGPETLTVRDALTRVAHLQGLDPVMIPVGLLTPLLSSLWVALVTRADLPTARRLIESLTSDLVSSGRSYWEFLPHYERIPFDDAIRRALFTEERALPARSRAVESLMRVFARRPQLSARG